MTAELWNGDSRDLAKNLPEPINCVITDPPYGVGFRSRRAETPQGKEFVDDIEGDGDLDTALALFNEVMDIVLPKCAPLAELYVFTRWDIVDTWMGAIRDLSRHGFSHKMTLIWEKGYPGMGSIDACWGCGHEMILYAKRGQRDVPYRRSGIIHVDKLHSKGHIHPTEKPSRLIEKLIEMSTDPGELIVDPFAGSASTIVAARDLGRRAIGIEKDEVYYQRALPRLEQGVLI